MIAFSKHKFFSGKCLRFSKTADLIPSTHLNVTATSPNPLEKIEITAEQEFRVYVFPVKNQ